MRGRPLAHVFLLLAILIWGFAYVVTKSGLDAVPPMMFALLRYSVASLLLVPLALARGGLARLPQPVPWKTLILMAIVGVALYYVLFNLALAYTSASRTALIQSAFPAIVAIMAVFWLRERVTGQRFTGIGLAIVGVVLIVATQDDATARNPLLGNTLAFASVLSWSAYTILAKRLSNADPIAVTAVISLIGTVLLVPATLIENADVSLSSIPRDGWFAILYLGGLASAASYLLYSRALRDIDASLVGAFINLSPVIGVVSGVLVLGEAITPTAIIGGVMVLVGVWLSSRR
jgi:drug/metabolite transporter (DMT)-like permease